MSDNKTNSEEIDLGQMLRSIRDGLRNFGQVVLNGIAALRRVLIDHKIFFFILVTAGLIIGAGYFSGLKKRHYTSSMIIRCSYLNMRIVEGAVMKLNLLCKEADREGLSETLNIDLSTGMNVRQFEASSFVSEQDRIEIEVLKEQLNNVAAEKKDLVSKVIGKIEIGNTHAFRISVSVFNPDIVQKLDSAIVKYFRNNEYVRKRIDAHSFALISRRAKLVSESRKLDSLKNIVYANFQAMSKQSREGSNNVILSDKYLADPIDIFKEDLDLNKEIVSINENLKIRSDFEVVDGLTTYREPDNTSLPLVLATALGVSIALGYLLIGLWRFNKYLATIG